MRNRKVRTQRMQMLVAEDEKKVIEDRAKEERHSVSAYLRRLVIHDIRRERERKKEGQ